MERPAVKHEKSDVPLVNLIVQNQQQDRAQFAIKKTSPLRKLIDAYHRRMGAVPNTYRLLFEGNRITDTDTAESLDMADMNVIDAFVIAEGGFGLSQKEQR